MQTFCFKRDSWPSFRNQVLLRTSILGILAVGTGLFVAGGDSMDEPVLWISLIVVGGAISVGLYRGIQRQRLFWQSFEIVLTGDEIVRRQANTPEVKIHRSEVRQICEVPGKSIAIYGPNRFQIIAAPAWIESYQDLVDLLRAWNTPYQSKPANKIPIMLLVVLATLGLFVVAFAVEGIAGALAAVLLIVELLWCHREIRLSPHYDKKTKKGAWAIWLVIVSLIFRVLHTLGFLYPLVKK
jgi:hypothetical protein